VETADIDVVKAGLGARIARHLEGFAARGELSP
jgi:hypothetical protein